MVRLLATLMLSVLLLLPMAVAAETLYGADGVGGNLSKLYVLNPANGSIVSTVGSIGFAVTGLAVQPGTGVLYGSTSSKSPVSPASLIRVDRATGVGTLIGSFNVGSTMADLTFTRDGTLYGWAGFGDLFQIDVNSGNATRMGFAGLSGPIGGGIAADASDLLYVSVDGDNGTLQIINRITGTPIGQITLDGTTGDAIAAMAFDAAGTLFGSRLDKSGNVTTASLITIDKSTGHVAVLGPTVNNLDAIAFDSPPACAGAASNVPLVASVLPVSRSVEVGSTATAFVTVLNSGASTAASVGILPQAGISVDFSYQTTSCATNALTGTRNAPTDIGPGAAACFAVFITPTDVFDPIDVPFGFAGCNTAPVGVIEGVNTLLLSGSDSAVADVIALAATLNNDGIVNIPGVGKTGVFSVAVDNVGAGASITATADTGDATLPVNIVLCQTNSNTGACMPPVGPEVTVSLVAGATATFGVFVQGGDNIAFDPANNRVFVRFNDDQGVTRGATSVAVRTQ